jgi:tetratricopeptide (TPR) repeat protein
MTAQYMIVPAAGAEPADEWVKLGVEAQMGNRPADAARHYLKALGIDPSHVIATLNHGITLATQGDLNQGMLTLERAMLFDDKSAAVRMNYAMMCLNAGRIDEAMKYGELAIEMGKTDEGNLGKTAPKLVMALILGAAGHSDRAVPLYNEILDDEPDHLQAGMNSCFAQTLTFATPEDLLRQRKRFYDSVKFKGTVRRVRHDEAWPRPLRVGYVGGDFKQHSAAMIFGNVLLNHDKTRVLPYFYSSLAVNPDADPWSKEFKAAAEDRWRDIEGKSDDDTADMIRDDKIDILVDIAAHTSGGRLPIFVRKPAPIQVTAWGFAHGTGVPEIDYFFADEVSVPQEERQWFAEKIWDLPCLVTFRKPKYVFKENSLLPYAGNGYITFGSSARYEKLSEACLRCFAKILHRVPDSVLRLKDSAYGRPYSIRRVLDIMKGFDIGRERIQFIIGSSHEEHLQGYRNSDLQLDPFPHGGGIVSLEQLYMGLPIITLYGTQCSGRNTASVLTCMGRGDWIARSEDEYVEKAVALANDIEMLRSARKTLRSELMDSPVVKDYCKVVERAYQAMWCKYCGYNVPAEDASIAEEHTVVRLKTKKEMVG